MCVISNVVKKEAKLDILTEDKKIMRMITLYFYEYVILFMIFEFLMIIHVFF